MGSESREQRLVLRVLTQWRGLCRNDSLPRRSQVDPRLFAQDWVNCLLIDIDPKIECSRFSYIGDNLRDPNWPTIDRQSLAECQEATLLYAATSYASRVIAKRAPISTGGVGVHQGAPVVYRSILLPLAEDGERIDGMLGAANFRAVPATEDVHPAQEQPPRIKLVRLG
jgi:hypothetical protein